MTDSPRLAFVGVGWIGRHRMQAILKTGLVEAAVVCDRSPQAMDEAIRMAPRAARASSLDEVLKHDIDGLVIATPNALHADQCLRAFEAGLDVFCQKPLGRDAAEVRRILDAARKHDRALGIDMSYRHVEGAKRIRDMVRAGDVGDVFACDLAFHNAYGPDKAWFYDPTQSGGGCVLDLGIHLIDLALWTLDFPRVTRVSSRLYAQGRVVQPGTLAVEDHAFMQLDLDNDATLNLACSWRGSHGRDAIIGAAFHGIKGALRLSNVNGSFWDFRAERLKGTTADTLAEPPDDWSAGAITEWAQRVARGEGFDATSMQHLDVMETLDKVYGR